MKTNQLKIHSQEYMETMARLMSEALESPEGMRALAAAIAAPRARRMPQQVPRGQMRDQHLKPRDRGRPIRRRCRWPA